MARSQGFASGLCRAICKLQKITCTRRCIFTAICFLIAEIHCNVGRDASITASAMPRLASIFLEPSGISLERRSEDAMGGRKKRGVENLTNDIPPKKEFWTPLSYGTFSTPLRCQCSVFPVQNSTTEQTRSSFGGVQNFSGECVLWYGFLPPYALHPPISRPKLLEVYWSQIYLT